MPAAKIFLVKVFLLHFSVFGMRFTINGENGMHWGRIGEYYTISHLGHCKVGQLFVDVTWAIDSRRCSIFKAFYRRGVHF